MAHPFVQYLNERFPVAPYLVLIAAMVAGMTAAACDAAGVPVTLGIEQGIVVVVLLLGFFHLRVFDEHKDYDKDTLAHPERVLSRGLVTLPQLLRVGIFAIVLEVAFTGLLGPAALVWTGAFIAFSVAMRYEFGIGEWLNRHILVYAVSHNPIVALMLMVAAVVALGGTAFPHHVVWYLVLATFTSLGFEIGRKVRAPDDELEGQDTYTAALGVKRAAWVLVAVTAGSMLAARVLIEHRGLEFVSSMLCLFIAFSALSFAKRPNASGAKLVENTATLGALCLYLLVLADVLIRRGVSWS